MDGLKAFQSSSSVLDLLRKAHTPLTLPFHVNVPSLPGYGFSSGPPLDRNFLLDDVAWTVDALMKRIRFLEAGMLPRRETWELSFEDIRR